MSKQLFRSLVIVSALVWIQTGSLITRLLTGIDAGSSPALLDGLKLAGLVVLGLSGTVALLRAPVADITR